MHRFFGVFILFIIMPVTSWADIENRCDDLWFARNSMMNDAGYCFSSTLGKSLFDNSDCTTKKPVVSKNVAAQIRIIQNLERDPPFPNEGKSCRVDTTQTNLSQVQGIEVRKRVKFQPATDGASSICIGYQGDDFDIYAAPDLEADILGKVEDGNSLSMSHLEWNDWDFSIVWSDVSSGEAVVAGWYQQDIGDNCKFFAG